MVAIITGDIVDSRKVAPEVWLPRLKKYLQEHISNKDLWEIYRGDSFQAEVPVEDALRTALSIKALVKTNNIIDVRMSIGIGDKIFDGRKITESNGTAFVNSGESFERIKNFTLITQTPNAEFDEYFNPILRLIGFIGSQWKPVTAETIHFALTHPALLQKEIATRMSKDKTTVNKALKRGGYDEILEVLDLYSKIVRSWAN